MSDVLYSEPPVWYVGAGSGVADPGIFSFASTTSIINFTGVVIVMILATIALTMLSIVAVKHIIKWAR